MSHRPRVSFDFHAEGHAFSAEVRRPIPQHIDALAATSLPTIGGHGHSRIEDFRIPRVISFRSAHTHVSGTFAEEKLATTHATASIEGYNLLDFITADRITARLTSEHNIDEVEGHIIALGSTFDNLKIGGYPVKIVLRHELLLKCKTHKELDKAIASDAGNGKIAATKGGLSLCSLVEEIITDFPGLTAADKKKHILRIPHFGTVAFAEILSEEGTKTLTMLKFELGCPDEMSGTTAQARTNGQPPPTPPGPSGT
jgi:hypothetical protein